MRGVWALEPTLVVIGVNYRSAPVEVRERFWISESRRYEALVRLARSEAIEEIAVLATSNRTEFILWTRDASAAANSVLNFLTAEYGLRLCEWKHFYRLIGDAQSACDLRQETFFARGSDTSAFAIHWLRQLGRLTRKRRRVTT